MESFGYSLIPLPSVTPKTTRLLCPLELLAFAAQVRLEAPCQGSYVRRARRPHEAAGPGQLECQTEKRD